MQRFWIAAWISAGLIGVIFLHSVPGFAEQVAASSVHAAAPANPSAAPPSMGFGMMLARMVFMLAAVCTLAAVSLRWGLKRITQTQSGSQSIEVMSRAIIEPRRAILVVRIGTKHLIVGTGEHGMTPLGELSEDEADAMKQQAREFQESRQQTKVSFKKIFAATARSENSGHKPTFVLESSENTENAQSL